MKKNLYKTKSILMIIVITTFFMVGCSHEYFINKTARTLSNYTIEATFNDSDHTLEVYQKVFYKNKANQTLNNLKFNLYPKAFSEGATNKPVSNLTKDKAYPNGESYGDIKFSSITSDENSVHYTLDEIDENILNISLPRELKRGHATSIEMNYTLTIPNIHHRFGYGENTINLGNFYPIACVFEDGEFVVQPYSSNGDPFYSELNNYSVTVTYPLSYNIASTGEQIYTHKLDNGYKETTATAKSVRDFAVVLSDKFNLLSKKHGHTTVFYYYYNDENPEDSIDTAVKALKTFNDLIGEYPYTTLSVVETNFVHGGMEYPNLVYVSDCLNNYEDYTNVIVHEIAHQWWYSIVGNNSFKYGWLDEGLTEYTTALFYEFNEEYNIKVEDVVSNALVAYNMFTEVYTEIFGSVDTSLTRSLSEYKTEPEYVYSAYVKPMLMYHDLRKLIGDRKFFASIKNYYKKNKMKNVKPDKLISAFKKTSRRKLSGWFDAWIDGEVIIKQLN